VSRAAVVAGVHSVHEALLASPAEVREVWVAREAAPARLAAIREAAAAAGVPLLVRDRLHLTRLVGHDRHQGVAARLAGLPEYASLDALLSRVEADRAAGRAALLVLLDGVVDPQNLGAIVRSAEAAGAQGVVVPKDRAAGLTPAAVRASAGAAYHLPVARVTNLVAAMATLDGAGVWTVGTVAPDDPRAAGRGVEAYDRADLTADVAIVIGAEGRGLRRLVAERCDRLVTIPLAGRAASLNASAAAAVVLFEALRQRRARRPAQ
jgi:23S rRNA (guanosine2251-2'-O)-methyltransferase